MHAVGLDYMQGTIHGAAIRGEGGEDASPGLEFVWGIFPDLFEC